MSDILKQKSEDNLSAAKYLDEKSKHIGSIVRASYYSCFQLMKYVLLNVIHRTTESLNSEQKCLKKGTHETYIKLIFKELFERDKKVAITFNNQINELRNLRYDYDYEEKPEDKNHGWSSILKAENIKNILKDNFKI